MLPGCVRSCMCLGSLANHPEVTRSAISEPISGVHHQRAPNAAIAATAMKKTSPGGNFGYAGSPDNHCIQIATAHPTRPVTVNFVGNVKFDKFDFIGVPSVGVERCSWERQGDSLHVSLSDQCRGWGIEPDGLPANTDVSQSSNCSPGTRNEPRTRPLSTERFRSLGFMPMEKSANITRGAAASRARDDAVWLLTARTAKSIRSVEPQ